MGALLSAGPAAAARFVRQAEASGIALDELWCLKDRSGRYRLAAAAFVGAGRSAMLLASRIREPDEVPFLAAAISAALRSVADRADLGQALVDPASRLEIEAFESAGLGRIAMLEYLERSLPRAGLIDPPAAPSGWSIAAVDRPAVLGGNDPRALDPSVRAEIAALLEATYVDTLDCPGLAGMRRIDDVIDGHFGSGTRPRHWIVARESGVARGLCLINGPADGGSAELVYLGLAREARGRGIARLLLSHGLRACGESRTSSLTLAVDERNAPARRLYGSLGFRRVSSRVALVRALRAVRATAD